MLERFETVNKVGLFEAYSHSPGCELGEVTLIYGENGVGKSTLAAILDSLRERNAGELVRRRSLPGDVAPTVVVRLNGKDYSFDGHDWDDQPLYDTLDVFYPGFVTRNVYTATGVDPEHRRNLCELVLGRKAVEKVTRLALADSEGRAALTEIKAIDKQLELLIKKPETLETFLGLSNDPEIDQKMEKVRTELKEAQSKDAILARAVPKEVPLPQVDRDAIAQLLEKNTESIGANIAAVMKTHIKEHLDRDGEAWLAYGAKHIGADSKCPFCAQETAKSDLVTAIRSYFSAEYRTFTESMFLEIQRIRERLGSAVFAQIRAGVAGQLAEAAQWADVMPIDKFALATTLNEAEAAWKCGATKLETVVASKEAKPLERMEPSLADEAVEEYERALIILAKVNILLAASAKKAEERRAALSKADTTEIEKRLHRFENQKARFEPLAQELFGKRNALIEKRNKLDGEKVLLKREIDEHATTVVGKYQASINHYLAHFVCDIRIESVEPRFPSGRASVQYKLKAHGHEIELGLSDAVPCFETVLSDGDKYTLALSFFFARLKDHASLSGRIVVLDDPVNSLGSSRRTLIEGVIRDFRVRGAQVVVLTHDERLAAMMWRDKTLRNIVSLQVERTRTGSHLKPWDVERATQSEYVKHYLALVEYLENGGDHKTPAGYIRPYLEQRLRHLFPGPPFQTRDNLGQMISKIRDSAPGSRLHVLLPKVPELESINDAALPSHHATDDVSGMPPLSPDGVRLFAQKALDVLE
jgi:wobble nucleotide-excising tRNase